MTLRKLDYVLYLNARRWMDEHNIVVDQEDAPILTKEAVIEITVRDVPVIIRGVRKGPLAKSQLIPKRAESTPTKKAAKKKADDVKVEPEPEIDGQKFVFVIAPENNPFSKKEDVEKVTLRVPMDGSAEVVVASAIVAPQIAGVPFIRNIKHSVLAYNPMDHSSSGSKVEVIRDRDIIRDEVLFDIISPNLAGMAKIRISIDPYAFWLDAHPDDVIKCVLNAEDTIADFKYLHVVK